MLFNRVYISLIDINLNHCFMCCMLFEIITCTQMIKTIRTKMQKKQCSDTDPLFAERSDVSPSVTDRPAIGQLSRQHSLSTWIIIIRHVFNINPKSLSMYTLVIFTFKDKVMPPHIILSNILPEAIPSRAKNDNPLSGGQLIIASYTIICLSNSNSYEWIPTK